MTPLIRIDDDVMNELKKKAYEFGLVFEPPNLTLRKIFNLDVLKTSIEVKDRNSTVRQDSENKASTAKKYKQGWKKDLIDCIERLHKVEFSLEDLYRFEPELKVKHPENKHIREAIRGTLQILRNEKIIDFIGWGEYKIHNR